MGEIKNLDFDILEIYEKFSLSDNENCTHLSEWLNQSIELDDFDNRILNDLHEDILQSSEAMNEEELKTRMVGLLFYTARIDTFKKIRVFYERPLAAVVNNIPLSVICDCMVAAPVKSLPKKPYFFLQEFKKSKGDKKDPEAQMLVAMLIAQSKNADDKPLYGGYLIGTGWHFTTLIDKDYCLSRKYEATNKADLIQIVSILRQLKSFIENR
jgi:hypothetical protein